MRLLPLFSLLICAPAMAGDVAVPAPSGTEMSGSSAYHAQAGALTSIKDLQAFADKVFDSRWDLDRAAKVEGLKLERDAGTLTLDGWVFLRGDANGIRNRARFFGKARFQLSAPVDMERQQIKRFLGKDSVDLEMKAIHFIFTGAEDQQFFEGLTYTAEAAKAAEAENEDCKNWMQGVRDYYKKGESQEELQQRRLREFDIAARSYERVLDPTMKGWFRAEMDMKQPEGVDTTRSHPVHFDFDVDPSSLEEVSLVGTFDHGRSKPQSLITQFDLKDQYDDSDFRRGASSAFLETERKDIVSLDFNKLKITFDPSGKNDIHMVTDMQCTAVKDKVQYLAFGITPYMGVTTVSVDGKPAEFYQPAIPGAEWYHSRFIIVTVPRVFQKGEKIAVHMELDGKILENINGSTYIVKEEDNWFPSPTQDLGGVATKFDTVILAPKPFTAIANGKDRPCDPADEAPGMQCFHYVTNTGIDFATFNIGRDFRVDSAETLPEDADRDGKPDPKIPIRVFTNATAKNEFAWRDPDNPALVQKRSYSLSENGPDAAGRAQIAHKVYTEWFGPCPYDTLMITPHPKGHGRGSASLLLIWEDAFLSDTARAEWAELTKQQYHPYDMTAFLTHEIAHQWWGGSVRIRGGRDQWFSEGFADYACTLVLEELDKGPAHTRWFWDKLGEFRRMLLDDDGYSNNVAPLCLGNRFASAENKPPYDRGLARQNFMYSKGAYVMHMLRILARAKMHDPLKGDELFKTAMHDFVSECVKTGKAPSNADMERSFSKSFGMPLAFFFNQWVYGVGVPKVDWSYEVTRNADGKYVVSGRVHQKDTSFQFPLAVSVFAGKQEAGYDWKWIGKQDSEFTLPPLDFKPDRIDVNTDQGVLGIFKQVQGIAAAGQ